MTIEEWAGRVDEALAQRGGVLPAHHSGRDVYEALRARGVAKIGLDDPAWEHGGRAVSARVAEDGATLRAAFVPRGEADEAMPDEELSRLKTYVRSDVGAREAAHDIATFLGAP